MFGRIVFGILLTGVFVAVGAWAMGYLPAVAQDPSPEQTNPSATRDPAEKPGRAASLGGALYAQAAPAPAPEAVQPAQPRVGPSDPIIISNARLALIKKQEVPSQRDGVLMFIGVELKPGEKTQDEVYPVQMGNTTRSFRRLKEGDWVEKDQFIGLVDDKLAHADYDIKEAKLTAAVADKDAADKTREEALERYNTQIKLYNSGNRGATSLEDVRGAQLAWNRYKSEAVSKGEAIRVAEQELKQARKALDMHEIHAVIPGRVKTLYKHVGEAVKSLEPVLQIQNYDLLRAEGTVEVQYAQALQKGMEVLIEPILRKNPASTFSGHRLEITGLAVSKDPRNPLIVSSSEDGTVMVWERNSPRPLRILRHPTGVQAVACTPPGAKANLCLSGASDGYGRLWDLDSKSEKPVHELRAHRGPIHCVAFSPDGATCATGGEDNEIMIWNTATGDLRYKIPGHRNWVTALSFISEAQKGAEGRVPLQLVSAGRDDTVRIWKLGMEGAEQVEEIKRRSHDVTQLGVSRDGRYVLDEQGLEMRILTLKDRMTEAILHSPSQASKFRTLALFSPDSRLALTTSGSEGVLQLWRIDKARSAELRQFVPGLRSEATCAAFAPGGAFVVGGIKDRKIYLWDMPTEEEVQQRIIAKITNIEESVEDIENKVRIMGEFTNPPPPRRLNAGDIVTVVAYPSK